MVPRTAATQDDLRRHNRARLLRRLHESGAASRSDLVAYSGLNRSTVGVLVSELAEVGLVTEVAGAAGQVGRPSLMVQPAAESAVVVAGEDRSAASVALGQLGGSAQHWPAFVRSGCGCPVVLVFPKPSSRAHV